jgi:Holliday junction resolvasome RuvABC endonuclease subunit
MCALSVDGVDVRSVSSEPDGPVYRKQTYMLRKVAAYVKKDDIVVLEDFGVAARHAASGRFVERIELCGMLKLAIKSKRQCPLLLAPPGMLKSFITGNGKADKRHVVDAVKYVWNVYVADDDQADAFALAALARAYFQKHEESPRILHKFSRYSTNWYTIAEIKFLGLV